MMEDSLNNIHTELIKQLYKPFIFYIPRKFWTELDADKWNDKEFDDVLDTVVLIKSDGSDHVIHNTPTYYYLLGKAAELDKNIYTLMDLKAKLETHAFKFLIDKYQEQLDFYVRISTWLANSVKKDIPELSQETLKSFTHQRDVLKEHWDNIQKNLLNSTIKANDSFDTSLTKEDIKSLGGLFKNSSEVVSLEDKEQKTSVLQTNLKQVKQTKKEKKILVTEEEAEQFLLQIVFHIEL